MERLTIRIDGEAYIKKVGNKYCEEVCSDMDRCNSCPIREAFNKLAHYEDLEEQGRLIELPCKVGDTVWNVNEYADGFKIRPMEVESMTIKEGNKSIVYLAYLDKPDGLVHGYGFDDFGYALFLTKEEALAKLKELKEGAE
jgi:hypothetical protein